MKAFVIEGFGGVENFKLDEAPKPEIGGNEVLIAVKSASMNPVDYIMRQGYAFTDGLEFPVILGCDAAGIVEAVGGDVTDFKVGDRVAGLINFPGKDGTRAGKAFAEYVAAPDHELALLPDDVSFEQGAALSAVGLTANQALAAGEVKAGQRVLIHGASGGVGHIAVQLAKNAGAHVVATASAEQKDFVEELGADEVIDYKNKKFEEETSDIDMTLNTVGDDVASRSLKVMRRGATLISLIPAGPEVGQAAEAQGVKSQFMGVRANGQELSGLLNDVSEGKLQVHIGASYPFEQLPEAQTALQNGGIPGKIVVTL